MRTRMIDIDELRRLAGELLEWPITIHCACPIPFIADQPPRVCPIQLKSAPIEVATLH